MPIVSNTSGDLQRRVVVTDFTGINQSKGVYTADYASSPDAVNFICRNGMLRTAGGTVQLGSKIPHPTEPELVEIKPRLFQAFFRAVDGTGYSKLLASFDSQIYAYDETNSIWVPIGYTTSDGVDFVSYRHGLNEWAIFSDDSGDLHYWDGSGTGIQPITVTQGTDAEGHTIYVKCRQISLMHERIWGAVLQDSPDRVYWSASFEPDNWEINTSKPDEGGGFVDIATFDGSKVRAIIPAFDGTLVFKDRTIHKITGTYPGEFAVAQVYGSEGTLAPRSVVVTESDVYFLTSIGFCKYDGVSVTSLWTHGDRKLRDIWKSVNHAAIENVCAAYCNGIIYMALPLDSESYQNSHMIEYDVAEGTYSIVELPGVDDIMVKHNGQQKTVYVIIWDKVYQYDSGAVFPGGAIYAVWTSPEISLGSMASKKSTGRVYVTVEGTSLSVDTDPTVKLSLISGDKVRSKVIALKSGPTVIRTRIKVRGRSFRFRIENQNGNPLTIHRGMEIAVEETYD